MGNTFIGEMASADGGREIGEVERDEEEIQTIKVLGKNMAWLLKS